MNNDSYILGLDAGSSYIKSVLIDSTDSIVARQITARGAEIETSSQNCYKQLLDKAGLTRDHVAGVIATGYGRKQVSFTDQIITEVTALAIGGHTLAPSAGVIIDIGGQDSKVISLDQAGRVIDFAMNHKCAAGTGRFLEVTSASLGVDVSQLGPLSQKADKSLQLTSTCTVFAESEIISHVANGQSKENIIKALHGAIANQIIGLYHRISPPEQGEILFLGGVALNEGMVIELSDRLNRQVCVLPAPQYVGAFGAAMFLKNKK